MTKGRSPLRPLNLGLQGGGAHGAFTWGVLDALLEDGRITFDGISGTSAGAMNAVVLAHGLLQGGNDGARTALADFWQGVAGRSPFEIALPSPDGKDFRLNPAIKMMLRWTHHLSPSQLNPFDFNPLRDLLAEQIDFARLRTHSPVRLFIAATHANSGKLRLFREDELSIDAILASACLPTIHRAVIIDDEPYWDGGYSANPAVFPLIHNCRSQDILLVLLTPLRHAETPDSATEIKNRILDVAFNATFLREMRMFADLRQVVDRSWMCFGKLERHIAHTRFHIIDAEELINELGADTKLAASLQFFHMMRDHGRERAKTWLRTQFLRLGKASTVDIEKLFR